MTTREQMQSLERGFNEGITVLRTAVHRNAERDIASIVLVDAGPEYHSIGRYILVSPRGFWSRRDLADVLELYATEYRKYDKVQ